MKQTILLFLAGSALLLSACNSKENPVPGIPEKNYSDVNVRVEPIITRVTGTDFEIGDAIGLTITRESGVYVSNERLIYDGAAFSGALKWYAEGADEASLSAYYPYAESVPEIFTVEADQSAGTSSSDFVAASKSGVLPSANAIAMVFQHRLSRIVVNLTNNAGYTINGLSLSGSVLTAELDGNFVASAASEASPADIQAHRVSESRFEAIVVPQTVSFIATVDAAGVLMSQRLSEVTLQPGKEYTINMIVNPEDISVTISGNVTAWGIGGEISGYTREIPFEEHLDEGYFNYDGVRYGIKQLSNGLWIMTDNMAFVPDGLTPSSDPSDGNGLWFPYSSDGTVTTPLTDAASVAKFGYLYDHETVLGSEVTADNYKNFEAARGICPDGWHIPTRAELLGIVGYSNKADGESAAQTDANAIYYDTAYNGARIKTLNEDGLNISFAGSIMRNNNTTAGKYLVTVTKEGTCTVPEWLGANAVSYFMGSTGYTPNNTAINRQFMSLMTTFSNSYPEGRLTIAYSNYLGGYSLRCVRDAE